MKRKKWNAEDYALLATAFCLFGVLIFLYLFAADVRLPHISDVVDFTEQQYSQVSE